MSVFPFCKKSYHEAVSCQGHLENSRHWQVLRSMVQKVQCQDAKPQIGYVIRRSRRKTLEADSVETYKSVSTSLRIYTLKIWHDKHFKIVFGT